MVCVCDPIYAFFTFFLIVFGENRIDDEANKTGWFQDWFLFSWTENISLIDVVTLANFSILFLQHRSHFLLANEPYPLISWRYSPELFSLTNQILCYSIFNFTPHLLSLKLFCVLSLFWSAPISKFASSELHLLRPNSTKFDFSEMYANWKSLCSFPKSSWYF